MRKRAVSLGLVIVLVVVFGLGRRCGAEGSAQLEQAEELKDAGIFDKAEGIYKAVIAGKGPDALLAQEKLIDIYILQHKDNDAEAAYAQLVTDFAGNPGLAKAIDHVADDWRDEGRYEKALGLYQYLVDTYPDSDHTSFTGISDANAGFVGRREWY